MFSVLMGIYLGLELLGQMVTYCLIFKITTKLFYEELYHFLLPPTMHKGSNFSIALHLTKRDHSGCCIEDRMEGQGKKQKD